MTGIVVFGAGRIGRIHAGNVYDRGCGELLHVVDVDTEAARHLAERCAAQVSSVSEALADTRVGAVIIASPTDTHAPLIEASAAAGKAIFCEKPLDLDRARAERCVALAAEQGVPLCLGFNRRHDPSFARLRREVAEGGVGTVEVISITSRDPAPPPADYVARSGGLFRDMMIHDLDMARWLLGEEPATVYAAGSNLVDPSIGAAGDIDTAAVVLRTSSGKLCQVTNSRRCAYGYDQRIEIFGSAGMVRADNMRATQVERANEAGFATEPALPFFLERYAEAYRIQLEAFLAVIDGRTAAIASGEDGVRALCLADAAQRSLELGAPVSLQDDWIEK